MRRIFVFTVMLFATITMMAQKKVRCVSLELLGAQNLAGVNYDSRFKGNSGLGYRVGIGFGYGNSSYWINQDIKGVGVPIELNYLLGKRHHKLEVGLVQVWDYIMSKRLYGSIISPSLPKTKDMKRRSQPQTTDSATLCLAISVTAISVTMALCFV